MAKKENDVVDQLNAALEEVKAELGKDAVRRYSEQVEVEVIPSDFYEFNQATHIGGVPLGKIIEISGPESSGKTTLAWQLLSQVSRATKKKILFLDYEMSTSKDYLRKLGVPVEEVIFIAPEGNSLEDGFTAMVKLLKTRAFCGAIIDSLATMVPKAEQDSVDEKGLEGNDMMIKAKVLSKALRVYGPVLRNSGSVVIFINHLISKVQKGPAFLSLGEPEDTPGGRALKHHCDLRISLKPMGYVTQQVPSEKDPKKKVNIKIGRDVKIKFIKNRVGEPFGEGVMTLRLNKGFDIVTSVIRRGLAEGVILNQKGGEHILKDDKTVRASSYNNFWNLLTLNPKLTQLILSKLNGKAVKFDSSEFDLTAADREVSASELGISEDEETLTFGEEQQEKTFPV